MVVRNRIAEYGDVGYLLFKGLLTYHHNRHVFFFYRLGEWLQLQNGKVLHVIHLLFQLLQFLADPALELMWRLLLGGCLLGNPLCLLFQLLGLFNILIVGRIDKILLYQVLSNE